MANTNIITNKTGGKQVITHTWANDVIIVAGNNSVSNLTSNSSEVVVGATIIRVWFGSGAGTWVVYRSNSSVNTVVGVFNGTGTMQFDGAPINIESTKSLRCDLVGTANGFLMMELHKDSSF